MSNPAWYMAPSSERPATGSTSRPGDRFQSRNRRDVPAADALAVVPDVAPGSVLGDGAEPGGVVEALWGAAMLGVDIRELVAARQRVLHSAPHDGRREALPAEGRRGTDGLNPP